MSINKFNSEGYYDPTSGPFVPSFTSAHLMPEMFPPMSKMLESIAALLWTRVTFPSHPTCCFRSF